MGSTGVPLRRWSWLLLRSFPASFAPRRLPAARLRYPACSTRCTLTRGSSRLLWDLSCIGCSCPLRRGRAAHSAGVVSLANRCAGLTTPSAPSLRSAHPPLLCEEGNLHPARDFDTHQVQGFGERLTHDIHYENIEKFPVHIRFGNDPIPVIKEIESLSESERMFRQSRRFKRDEDLMPDLVHTQREIDEFPDIIRLVEIYPQFRIVQHFLDTAEIEPGIALAQFMEDVIAAYRSILDIGSGFAIEIQCFLEIERDNRRAGKLQ